LDCDSCDSRLVHTITSNATDARTAAAALQVESIAIDEASLAFLGQVAERTSLRHAVQLLTPAMVLASTSGRQAVGVDDLTEISELFHDAKASTRILAEQADKYIS
jgi:RuvB-like protein 1